MDFDALSDAVGRLKIWAPDPPTPMTTTAVMALRLAMAGDAAGGVARIERALGDAPDDPALIFAHGYCAQIAGRPDVAAVRFRQILEVGEVAEARYNLAVLLLGGLTEQDGRGVKNIGPATEAEVLLAALAGGPLDADGQISLMLGHTRMVLGDDGGAVRAFSAYAADHGESGAGWRGLAEAQRRQGDLEGALASLAKALTTDPQDGSVWRAVLDIVRQTGDIAPLSRIDWAACPDVALIAEAEALKGTVEAATALLSNVPSPRAIERLHGALAVSATRDEDAADHLWSAVQARLAQPYDGAPPALLGRETELAECCLAVAEARRDAGDPDGARRALLGAWSLSPRDPCCVELAGVLFDALLPPVDQPDGKSALASRLCLHIPVWGSIYRAFFVDHMLPSLLAPGNLPALADALTVELVIHTLPDDAAWLSDHPVVRRASALAEVTFRTLPPDWVAAHTPYHVLEAASQDVIAYAKERDAALGFLQPDYVLADGVFRHVLALAGQGGRAVSTLAVSVDRDRFVEGLPPLDDDGRLTVTAPDLVSLATDTLHPVMDRVTYGAEDFVDWPFMMLWRGADAATWVARGFMAQPLYVYPRDWDAGFTKTVDWDYAVRAVPDAAERAWIEDSDRVMIVECSPTAKSEPAPGAGRCDPVSVAVWAKLNMPESGWANFAAPMIFHGRGAGGAVAAQDRSAPFAAAVAYLLEGR